MPQRGAQNKAVIDKLLTNVSNMYPSQGMIAEKLLTPLQVIQTTGIIPAYGNGHLRIVNSVGGGSRSRARFANPIERITDRKYQILHHELQSEIGEMEYSNVEEPYDAESDETEGLTSMLLVEKEYSLGATLTDTNVLTNNTTLVGGAKFSDYDNSDPIKVFKDSVLQVKKGCGAPANIAVVPWEVAMTLSYHPQILKNLGFAEERAGTLTYAELARAMQVKAIMVPEADYNAAKEGAPDNMLPIWGKNIIFMHVAPAAQKKQTTLGYYATYKGEGSRRVKKWTPEDTFDKTGILVGDNYSFEITNVGAGYLIKDAI